MEVKLVSVLQRPKEQVSSPQAVWRQKSFFLKDLRYSLKTSLKPTHTRGARGNVLIQSLMIKMSIKSKTHFRSTSRLVVDQKPHNDLAKYTNKINPHMVQPERRLDSLSSSSYSLLFFYRMLYKAKSEYLVCKLGLSYHFTKPLPANFFHFDKTLIKLSEKVNVVWKGFRN